MAKIKRLSKEEYEEKLNEQDKYLGEGDEYLDDDGYPEDGYAGAIYMGTGGPNPAAGAGLAMASAIGKLKGKKHKRIFG